MSSKDNKSNTSIVIKNTSVSLFIKGASLIVALLTTPAYINYFHSSEVLGLWFTVLSVITWILNCDMGIGNGLRDKLVYAINNNDRKLIRTYISSAYFSIFGIGTLFLILTLISGLLADWNTIFNISTEYIDSHKMSCVMIILLSAIILQLILRLVTSILYALQDAFVPGLLNLISNTSLLVFVLAANWNGKNNDIIALSFVYLTAVNLPLIITTIWVFARKLPGSFPKFSFFQKKEAMTILNLGLRFMWLQLIAMILDNTASYLISIFISNSAVVEYQIYYRIFNIPITVAIILSTSMWSTITKAKAENDWEWIRSSYRKNLIIAFALAAGTMAVVPVLQIIFDVWLRDNTIPVNYGVAAVIALYSAVMCYRTIIAGYSNGLRDLKIQIIFTSAAAIINIPLAYILTLFHGHYVSVIIANILSVLPYCIVQTISFHRKIIRHGSPQVS